MVQVSDQAWRVFHWTCFGIHRTRPGSRALMPLPSSPRAPLARTTLLKMGGRIGVIIALSTLFSYLHMLHTLRTKALAQLQQHVTERSAREQAIFVLAEDNHAFLKKALEERIRALEREDVSARFDRLFVRLPDGTVRSRPELVDGSREVQGFIAPHVVIDAGFRARFMAAYDVLTWYGRALSVRFNTIYINLMEGAIVGFWPWAPSWAQQASSDFSITDYEDYALTQPKNNPERKTIWTGIYLENVSHAWMASVGTPVDVDGQHVASIGHDVLLDEFMHRTVNDHLPGAYNIIFREDGQLIAHPDLKLEGVTTPYNIPHAAEQPAANRLGSKENAAHLRDIFERVKNRAPDQTLLELPEYDEYIAVMRLKGPGWYLATVLPESMVTQPAFAAARYVLLLGLLSLLVELIIMYRVLQQQISRPLENLTQATDKVAAGDFKVALDTARHDELGQLARAFQLMADEVQRREEALRQSNENLEQRVEERTREIKELHTQWLQTARRAGMAEIATNVLHNVGNVLNSVYTSAQLAKDRMAEMRVDHVGRVARMLEERQSDLTTFLTQDARGRHLMPFLDKLGKNLHEEREQIISLLDDVGRYTEHIGDIVKVQQNYARTPRLHEQVTLEQLVEDALRINAAGLTRHQVKVVRDLASLPPVMTDKHKTLMILVNLVSNAKYALDTVAPGERLLTVKLEQVSTDRFRIGIHDNGMGIAPEMLIRIFQHGFTTRADGHGFGLHASALAAQEMGGSLTVHSEGLGRGATFTLELPYHPVLPQQAA
ncbi:sensor histidine kinase [Cystobacter fuscus DSM 2262]|uniref:histidine kinase n=2 Tax=Cystobacter fuscus TaxID=43 RepID=S9R3T8_CYSF2|nr:sensor histidine kinase [Cystobacter fuscus DSM 2262]